MTGVLDGGRHEGDRRLYLVCCGADSKAACTWAPCPANVDSYSGPELRALAGDDEHRVDEAIAIFVTPADRARAGKEERHGAADEHRVV